MNINRVYESMTEYLEGCTAEVTHKDRRASRQNEWSGQTSWADAVKFATEGWNCQIDPIERMAADIAKAAIELRPDTGFVTEYDVAGDSVDMGRYCGGEPENMLELRLTEVPRHGRVVRLVVPVCCSCNIETETFLKRGAAIVALTRVLQRSGYVLDVWAVDARHGENNSRFAYAVHVQHANQPLDIGVLAFAIGNDAMLRRLGFSMNETENQTFRRTFGIGRGGYGRPSYDAKVEDLPEGYRDNVVILPSLNSNGDWETQDATEWVTSTVESLEA